MPWKKHVSFEDILTPVDGRSTTELVDKLIERLDGSEAFNGTSFSQQIKNLKSLPPEQIDEFLDPIVQRIFDYADDNGINMWEKNQ